MGVENIDAHERLKIEGIFFVNAVSRGRNMVDDQNLNNFFKDDLIVFSDFDFPRCQNPAHKLIVFGTNRMTTFRSTSGFMLNCVFSVGLLAVAFTVRFFFILQARFYIAPHTYNDLLTISSTTFRSASGFMLFFSAL